MQKFLVRFGAAVLFLAFGGALSPPGQAQALEVHTAGGVTYLTGGIGTDEVAALRKQAPAYSAMIEFVEVEAGSQRGDWTADVAVDVKSGKQTVASINVSGPMLLLRLAPGRYTLEATHGTVKLVKSLDIKAGGPPLRERFIWRAAAGSLGSGLRP
jgi:hypothetical protein